MFDSGNRELLYRLQGGQRPKAAGRIPGISVITIFFRRAGQPPYTYTVRDFSREQRNRVVSMLGEAGYVSVTDGANMENHNSVRDFYSAYLKGQDSLAWLLFLT